MRFLLHCLIALTAISCSASAFANAGATSAGVTTTDPNAPSTEVQQQSSGFVAANQQLQNGQANGIALPNGVAGVGIAQSGPTGAGNADAKGGQAGQSGAQSAAAEHAAPAAPATPPPPPPTYESKMRPVSQSAAATVAPAPVPTAAPPPPAQAPTRAPAKAPAPAAKPPPAPVASRTHAAPAEKSKDEPAPAVAADPGGGRGVAPDGYTFWFGLLIAGALLALAAATWLRMQRGETSR